MSSTLAGNLTITGSVANIIVVEKARAEAHISFLRIHEDWCAGNADHAGDRAAVAEW